MSIAQYAKTRGADRKSIRRQIQKGVITLLNGRIDPEQADASWGRIRRARIAVQDSDDGKRSANAKIAAAVAKLRLAKDRFEAARERYVDRDEAVRVAGVETDYVLAALRAAPARHAAAFAQGLAIEPRVARRILTRFVAAVVSEIGDLRAEAIRAAEAA
jgi:hypothetical protein